MGERRRTGGIAGLDSSHKVQIRSPKKNSRSCRWEDPPVLVLCLPLGEEIVIPRGTITTAQLLSKPSRDGE